MPDIELKDQFKSAGTAGHSATLPDLLGKVAGVTIVVDQTLSDNLKQSAINVTSVFQPNPCTPEPAGTGTVPGGTTPGTPAPQPPAPAPGSGGNDVHFDGGGGKPVVYLPPAESRLTLPLRQKLVTIGSAFNELLALLDEQESGTPSAGGVATRGKAEDPHCWGYQHTIHGPTGLFRAREVLKVRASGWIETLGGVTQANANTEYLMFMEYSVNTYLSGQAAWTLDPVSQELNWDGSKVVLNAVSGCHGTGAAVGGLKSCGSDSVSDVLRVVVKFKKLILWTFGASGSSLTGGGGLQVHISKMQEQSFAGVMPFTHTAVSARTTGTSP